MFQVGDKVRPLDLQGEGVVVSIAGKKITVEMDGLPIAFTADELVKVEFDAMVRPAITAHDLKAKDRLKSIAAKQQLKKLRSAKDVTYEIDLHIHELLDRHEHLSNAQILEHQMRCCKRFMAEAQQKKWRKVILIHGVGEGVLRSEIHHWLQTQERVQFHDAPYRTYGYGATEVTLL